MLVSAAANAAGAVQWPVSAGGNGHWYLASANRMTFPEALAWAQSAGGHLATIGSAGENAILFDLARTTPGAWVTTKGHFGAGPFFGAQQLSTNPGYAEPGGGWRWVTGEPLEGGYQNFCANQPDDNSGGGQSVGSFYGGTLYGGDQQHPCWDDIFDAAQLTSLPWTFLVEWDADCNNDGIVDYGQCRDGSLPDYNGNNIPDCCEQGVPCVVGNYPVQWPVSAGGNGHWYEVSIDISTWPAARDACVARGGMLACCETAAECNFLRGQYPAGTDIIFVGLFQDLSAPEYSEPSGGWKWLSGAPFDSSLWQPGEPNNYFGDERFGELEGPGRPPFLNDVIPGGTLRHFVEWSADCNNDGIVDYGQILRGELADTNANGVPDICESTLLVPSQYPTIQAAIDAVPANSQRTIQVAAGTYHESFALNGKDVIVRGAANNTTILDGTGLTTSIAKFTGGEPATAGVENLVFRHGTVGSRFTPKSTFTIGGALFGINSSASVRNCRFEQNTADFGGGAYLIYSQVLVENCVFASNTGRDEGGGLMTYQSTGVARGCNFSANVCGINGLGAGSAFKSVGARVAGESFTLETCSVTGGIAGVQGAAVEHFENTLGVSGVLRLVGTTITGNSAPTGAGGLHVGGGMYSCVLSGGTSICSNTARNVDGPYLIEGTATVCDCLADLTQDGAVNGADLGVVLNSWGITLPSGAGDVNHDGVVDGADLGALLNSWGACH